MKDLINNITKIHTTNLGESRIKNNLKIDNNSIITKKSKNWYCQNKDIIITINSSSYTIITAHKI